MTYAPEEAKVNSESKNGKEERVFETLERLAAVNTHRRTKKNWWRGCNWSPYGGVFDFNY